MLTEAGYIVTADSLATAWGEETKFVALTVDERDDILAVLNDPPDGLCELRAVLLEQHVWRRRAGL